MGGKPSRGTPADKRLAANKPKTVPASGAGTWSSQGKPQPKKGGK
jgi:hypothetical protein